MDFPFVFLLFFCSLRHSHSQNFFSSSHKKKEGIKIKRKFSLRREKSSRLIAKAAKTFSNFLFFLHFERTIFNFLPRFVFFHKIHFSFLIWKGWNFFFTRRKIGNFTSTRSSGSLKTENCRSLSKLLFGRIFLLFGSKLREKLLFWCFDVGNFHVIAAFEVSW